MLLEKTQNLSREVRRNTPPLDPAADRELEAFVDDRKAAVPDAWY